MASKKRDGLYKRGQFWWVRTDPIDGKPRSTGCRDKAAAELWRGQRERYAADPSYRVAQEAKLGEWVQRALAMKEQDSAASTVVYYESKLGHLVRIWGEDCRLSTIDEVKVDAYVKQRRDEGASEGTISKEYGALAVLLRAAKRVKAWGGSFDTLRPPDLRCSYKPRKRKMTLDEVGALLAALDDACAALVALCVGLGCRRSEGLGLRASDIDLDVGLVHIRGTKTAESDRHVPILSLFRPLVERAMAHLPLTLTPTAANKQLERGCRRAGISHFSFNDLRRTHASLLLASQVDNDVVRRLLGHKTTKLVDTVYGQLTAGELASLAEPKLLQARTLQADSPPPDNAEVSATRDRRARPLPRRSKKAVLNDVHGLRRLAEPRRGRGTLDRLRRDATWWDRDPSTHWSGRKGAVP